MAFFEQLRDAVNSADEVDVSHLLARLPQPASENLGHLLLDIVRTMSPELSLQAVDLLASMPHGAGNLFLVEALTEPGLRVASKIIDMLDLANLGPSWGRLPRVLVTLGAKHRANLVRRMLETPSVVPSKLWRTILLNAEPDAELEAVLACFARHVDDTESAAGPDCHAQRAIEHAMADGLLARLKANRDPMEVQRELARLLVCVIGRHRFIAREFMKMLATDGVCQRNRAVLAELVRDVGVLSEAHVNTAVPSFVALACCDDDELAQAALSTLHELADLGAAQDWQPLLNCPRDNAQVIAMRAFELQPGDVSTMARQLLSNPDVETRRRAVAMLNHRLLRGRAVGIESWLHYARRIANDPEPSVAMSLDVESLMNHTSDLTRFHAALELLRSPYPTLLKRVLRSLLDKSIWRAVAPAGRGDMLADTLFDAIAGIDGLGVEQEASSDGGAAEPHEETDGEDLGEPDSDAAESTASPRSLGRALIRLLHRMPVAHVVAAADRALPRLSRDTRRWAIERLRTLDDRVWREHTALYLRQLAEQRPLRKVPRQRARVWVMLSGLQSAAPRQRVRALRAMGRLENPAVLHHLAAALEDDDPAVARAAAHALAELRHPDALAALLAANARAVDPDVSDRDDEAPPETQREADKVGRAAALASITTQLTRHLARPEERPFAWPEASPVDPDGDVDSFEVWDRATGWLPRRSSWWAEHFGAASGKPACLGRLVLSDHSLWLRDRRHDDVVLWHDPITLTLGHGPHAGDWSTLVVKLAQERSYGTIELPVAAWVRRSHALDALPEVDDASAVFVRNDEVPAFLGLLRGWWHYHDLTALTARAAALSG